MNREIIDCIDAGTEYCPCHLAEAGECILCSQLQGKCFCDCLNWKGVCIYQEFANNNFNAKKGRETIVCKVKSVNIYENALILIDFYVPHKLAIDLVAPGSFIFIRSDEYFYFDVPISVLESDIENNIVTIMIEIRGIKTKKLIGIKAGDDMIIRGPYWNGAFGIKNINSCKKQKAIVIARGIGMAPMVPVIRRLSNNGNTIEVILDKAPFKQSYVDSFLKKYNITLKEMNVLSTGGRVSEDIKNYLTDRLKEEIALIHIAGADILTYKLIDFLNSINREDIKLSCCNNSKMCCGEGVCGSCTARFQGHKVKRLCKVQTDPRNIFEGRRFI